MVASMPASISAFLEDILRSRCAGLKPSELLTSRIHVASFDAIPEHIDLVEQIRHDLGAEASQFGNVGDEATELDDECRMVGRRAITVRSHSLIFVTPAGPC